MIRSLGFRNAGIAFLIMALPLGAQASLPESRLPHTFACHLLLSEESPEKIGAAIVQYYDRLIQEFRRQLGDETRFAAWIDQVSEDGKYFSLPGIQGQGLLGQYLEGLSHLVEKQGLRDRIRQVVEGQVSLSRKAVQLSAEAIEATQKPHRDVYQWFKSGDRILMSQDGNRSVLQQASKIQVWEGGENPNLRAELSGDFEVLEADSDAKTVLYRVRPVWDEPLRQLQVWNWESGSNDVVVDLTGGEWTIVEWSLKYRRALAISADKTRTREIRHHRVFEFGGTGFSGVFPNIPDSRDVKRLINWKEGELIAFHKGEKPIYSKAGLSGKSGAELDVRTPCQLTVDWDRREVVAFHQGGLGSDLVYRFKILPEGSLERTSLKEVVTRGSMEDMILRGEQGRAYHRSFNTISAVDLDSAKNHMIWEGSRGQVETLRVSPEGRIAVVDFDDFDALKKQVRVIDLQSGKELVKFDDFAVEALSEDFQVLVIRPTDRSPPGRGLYRVDLKRWTK